MKVKGTRSVNFAGEAHPRKMKEGSSNLPQSSYAENILNQMFPTMNIRITYDCNAPTYEIARVYQGKDSTYTLPCPRVDWGVEGKRFFAYITPILRWVHKGNLVTGQYDCQEEDLPQTLAVAAKIIKEGSSL